jgi:Gpi18-like mannosyltransferase
MSNWDGPDYLVIAQHGYTYFNQSSFFPLYPLAAHVVHYVIPSILDAALVVSWVCFAGAIYFYLKIVKYIFKITNNAEAFLGLLPFILFPTAVFMLATYTESLFAFLTLGAIYSALRHKYLSAAGFLLFATATHITGMVVLAFVALILLEQREKIWKILLTIAIGCLGLVSYMIYLSIRFHDALAFVNSQKNHGWLQGGFSHLIASAELLNIVFVILLIITAVYWWSRRKSFSIYSLLFILIPLIGKQFGGFNRYILLAIPLPLMIYGFLRNKRVVYPVVLVILGVIWAYFLLQYAAGYTGG